jgi:hypothetical protein
MSELGFTLSWILPFVRRSLRATSNFEYRTFVQQLWSELETAKVPGITRTASHQMYSGQLFEYDQAPQELRNLTAEAFFYLFRNGFICPVPPDKLLNHPIFNRYYVTQRGSEWFKGGDPLPEDVSGYMKFLRQLVSTLDAVVEQYIVEALTAFERNAFFAAAVMLGAASEKTVYLLADSILGAFKDVKKRQKLQTLLDRRKLLELFENIRDTIRDALKAKLLPYSDSEGFDTHLMSLLEAIRVQRNDAVHPMNATVSPDSVRLLIQSFPHALSKSEQLRAWFLANPNSI